MMQINPELLSAIERNQKWIERKCKISERCVAKYAELIQEVHYNLLASDKNFSNKTTINSDAWVKSITTNVTGAHIKQEIFEKSFFIENTENIEISHDPKVEMIIDLQISINYIKTKMRGKITPLNTVKTLKVENAKGPKILFRWKKMTRNSYVSIKAQ